MKHLAIIAALLVPALTAFAVPDEKTPAQIAEAVAAVVASDTPALTAGQIDSVSRAAATVMAEAVKGSVNNLDKLGLTIDKAVFNRALADALAGLPTGFSPQEADAYINSLVNSSTQEIPDTVTIESQQGFIAEQAAQPNAETTPSGLVFIVIQEGEGKMPVDSDVVSVNYVGRLSDGTIFDQTNGTPVEFNVNRLIPGFTEALKMMRPGGTYRAVIPYNLAYGEKGIPGVIPGYSALDFTVTLEGITPDK